MLHWNRLKCLLRKRRICGRRLSVCGTGLVSGINLKVRVFQDRKQVKGLRALNSKVREMGNTHNVSATINAREIQRKAMGIKTALQHAEGFC